MTSNVKLILSCFIASMMVLPGKAEQLPLQLLTEHKPPGTYRDEHGQVTGATVELIRHLQH